MIVNLETLKTVFDDQILQKGLHGDVPIKAEGWICYLPTTKVYSIQQGFWSVGGKYHAKIQVGNQQIRKRNELLYGSILGGRLIGVRISKLELYHARH